MEDLFFRNNSVDTRDEEEARKMDPVISGPIKNDVSAENADLFVTIDWKETGDIFEHSNDLTTRMDDAALLSINSFTLKSRNALTEEEKSLQPEKTDGKVTAEDVLSLAMEWRDPQEDNATGMNTESNELQLDGECWEHITNWTDNSTEQRDTGSSMTGDSSDSSTLSSGSLNVSTDDTNSLQSDSWIMQRQLMEPELRTDEINLVSCDSLSPGIGYKETFDVGTEAISVAPMESLHLSLVSSNNLILDATGTGSSSLHSMNLAMAGANLHMGSVPVKCLQLGAVNIASLTLGTVGISIIPMVSAGTIDINPFTESIGMVSIESLDGETISTDSENLITPYADHVNVDSITPEGVREHWHPLEDRLFALGKALTALDKKLEGFSPRLQEAESLLNDMDYSLTQHAMHINDIMNENTALAQRILQLEQQMRGEEQHHLFDRESEEDA